MKQKKKERLLATAIFLTGCLLAVSLVFLGGRMIAPEWPVSLRERYPDLYARGEEAPFLTPPDKTIYLTFDDGPSKNTEKILDMLAEQNVKATFFVSVQIDDKEFAAEMLRRIVREGHALGLHSYTHDFAKIYKSADAYLADISKLNDFIYEATGIRPNILRFPGGSRTANASRAVMKEITGEITRRGYLYYDWDVVCGDQVRALQSEETICENIEEGLRDLSYAIVLAHDSASPKTTCDGICLAIERLRAQGYTFAAIDRQVAPKHLR